MALLTARQLAAVPIDAAFRAWLSHYRIDAETYEHLTQGAQEIGSALSFEGERSIIWRGVHHEQYVVFAHADGEDHYAIPREAELPEHFQW